MFHHVLEVPEGIFDPIQALVNDADHQQFFGKQLVAVVGVVGVVLRNQQQDLVEVERVARSRMSGLAIDD